MSSSNDYNNVTFYDIRVDVIIRFLSTAVNNEMKKTIFKCVDLIKKKEQILIPSKLFIFSIWKLYG